MTSQFDQEVDDLEKQLAADEITLDVYNHEMDELQRDSRDAALEAAEAAYLAVLENR